MWKNQIERDNIVSGFSPVFRYFPLIVAILPSMCWLVIVFGRLKVLISFFVARAREEKEGCVVRVRAGSVEPN